MGIKGLTKFIGECGKLVSYSSYKNSYVAVDIFQKLYKYCAIRDNYSTQMNVQYNKHLKAVMNCVNHLTKFQIIPIFVFDGSSLAMKIKNKKDSSIENDVQSIIISDTSQNIFKKDTENNINENESVEKDEKKNVKRPSFKITPQQIKDCEKLLDYVGLPNIRAPYEADSQCAALTLMSNLINVQTVITDDTDALVFGAKSILRMLPITMVNTLRKLFNNYIETNPNKTQKICIRDIIKHLHEDVRSLDLDQKINLDIQYSFDEIKTFSDMNIINFAISYELNDVNTFLLERANYILDENNLQRIEKFTKDNFIDMCILFGTDYSQRVNDMNIDEIFKNFVLSGLNVETFLDSLGSGHKSRNKNYIDQYNDVKEYYKNASVIDPRTVDISIKEPIDEELRSFLQSFGFSRYYTSSNLYKYKQNISTILK